jgi:hypothetical protein
MITGWINALFPYLRVRDSLQMVPNPHVASWNNWASVIVKPGGPKASEFPTGLSLAPFVWDYFKQLLPMELLAGFVGIAQGGSDDDVPLGVRPAIGWVVRDAPKGP